MNNTLFEQFGSTYTQQGDYLLPNLILPAKNRLYRSMGTTQIELLKASQSFVLQFAHFLLTSGKLHSLLVNTEKQAQQLFLGW